MSRVTPRHNLLSNQLHNTGQEPACGVERWDDSGTEEKFKLLTRALSIKHSFVLAWRDDQLNSSNTNICTENILIFS